MQPISAPRHVERSNLATHRRIGLAVPIVAVVLGEAFRYIIPAGPEDIVVHLFWASVAIIGIILFALSMFWSIDRSEREVLRQNRELAMVNAVSKAVQDPESSDDVVVSALRSIVTTLGAARATVRIYPVAGRPAPEPVTVAAPVPPASAAELPLEVAMTTDSAVVGLLQVWPAGQSPDADDGVSASALQNISHQLGCAIQHRQLVAHLQQREREASALYDVAVMVSGQHSLADILARIVRSARDLLSADTVALSLTPGVSEALNAAHAPGRSLPLASDGAVAIVHGPDGPHAAPDHDGICPVRSDPAVRQTLEVSIRNADGTLGDIWLGRLSDRAFDASERSLLSGLAELASIAVTAAQLRERERLSATVAERERIARELHDSLAQVLGVTHLRLRAIGSSEALRHAPRVKREVEELAELNNEAYQDVREAILGLREASNLHRGFVAALAAYLERFSRQAGVPVDLDARLDGEPRLGPGSEIQVIRVIQEALANVRKHAHAGHALVRLTDDERGTTIEIEDDGRGFDPRTALSDAKDSFGLQTMRERMELVGGSLAVDSSPGGGTRVVARIPRTGQLPQWQRGGGDALEAAASHPAR